jgi:hypothetical protein
VLDFIDHIGRVKNIYQQSRYARCWHERVSAFYREDVVLLLGQMQRPESDIEPLRRALACVWADSADDVLARGLARE